MSRDRGTAGGRILGAARLAWGCTLIAAPRPLIRAAGGRPDGAAVGVTRILGARHAAQGAAELAWWPRGRRLGQVADVLHSVSLLPAAAADRTQRRALLTDAALAFGWAVAGGKV